MNELMMFEDHEVLVLFPSDVNFKFKGDFIICAKDVATVLEYQGRTATSNVLKFCKDDHIYDVYDSNLLNREVRKIHNTGEKFISNLSMNRVLGQSGQPKAIPFQDWIYEDVMTEIQKKGSYSMTNNLVQIPTELNMIGQLLEVTNHSYKAMLVMKQDIDETKKEVKQAKEENKQLKSEINDVKTGLVDINIPLRTQFNDAVKEYAARQQIQWDTGYNNIYNILGKQHHINIKLRAKRRGVKKIDILEELNLLVPAIRLAKTLSGIAS